MEALGWIQKDLPWFHAYAGPRYATICTSFCLKNSASNFLFGPDGVLIAKNIPTQEIAASINKLIDDSDFELKPPKRQPRFTIERFDSELATKNAREEDRGTVFVVSDAKLDEEVNNEQNSLVAFDDELRERWRTTIPQIYPGSSHRILLDPERDRLYVCDPSSNQFTAFDLNGRRL